MWGTLRGGGWDARIHWSSMLFSVKRVLENRAKPSRYSQARSGMYCGGGGNGEREKGRGINTSTFTTPSFCTCCFLRLACPAFFPTSSFMNLLKHQPPLTRSPSLPGGRSRGREMQKGTKLMGVFSAPPPHVTPTSSRCVPIPHQTISSRRTGAEPVLDTLISCSQHRILHHEGLGVRRMHGWREYSTSFVKRVRCLDPNPSSATHQLCDFKQVTQPL